MASGHHHPGESVSAYFTEQLLTVLVCGLLGFVGVKMYLDHLRDLEGHRQSLAAEKQQLDKDQPKLSPSDYQVRLDAYESRLDEFDRGKAKTRLSFLDGNFQKPVLWGGIAVLVLVGFRAVSIWKEAGEIQTAGVDGAPTCGIEHAHTADCDHDPNIGGHDHDDHGHSHDLSWVFARMLVLVFPAGLFFLGLPNPSFSADRQLDMIKDQAFGAEQLKELVKDATVVEETTQPDGSVVRVLKTKSGLKVRSTTAKEGGEPVLLLVASEGTRMRFNDLNDAAFDEAKRKSLEGETAIIEGRFKRLADKEFTLFRMKMTCCAADTVPLKVRIVVPQAMNSIRDFDWVRVKGQIQFFKVTDPKTGADTHIPVIMVADITDVRKAEAKNEYE